MTGPMHSVLRRTVQLLCLVSVVSWLAAPPASAHSAANSPSSNYVSTLERVKPATDRKSVV